MAEVALETVQIDEKIDVGFYERFKSLPLITQALSQTGTIYNKVKESNGLTQYACNAGENVVKTVATKAYNVGTPIAGMALRIAEPYVGNPVTTLDNAAGKTLAKFQETFPIIGKDPLDIVNTTVDTIKTKAGNCCDVVNNTTVVQFTYARVHEAITLSELAFEVLLPSSPDSPEDIEEVEQESKELKNEESKGSAERIIALGKKIKRRGSERLKSLKPVKFTYDHMIALQDNMTSLIHRSRDASKYMQGAILYIPSLALQLSGEAIENTKEFVINFKNAHSLQDLPGTVATASNQIIQPVRSATGRLMGQILLPPKMVAEFILSSKPIQCLVPNVVVFEAISKIEIMMDELVGDESEEDIDKVIEEVQANGDDTEE